MKTIKLSLAAALFIIFSISAFSQNIKWTKIQGSSADEVTWDLSLDSNGNCYAVGLFNGSMKIGTKTYNTKGGRDHFLAKYDCGGTAQWVQTIGSNGDEYPYQLRMSQDMQGNIYITNAFSGTCTFGGANNTSKSASSNGGYDIYVAKYDNAGNLKWLKTFGGSSDDVGYGIDCDDSNNVYVTGKFKNTVSFGSTSLSSSGDFDAFVFKLDNTGAVQWAVQGSSSAEDMGIGIKVDSKHNVIVSGDTWAAITYGGYTSNSSTYNTGYVAKLDINGDCLWLESMYSTWGDSWHDVAIDKNDNIYLGGTHGTSVTVTSEDGNTYSGSSFSAQNHMCVTKFDSSGNLIWFVSEGPSSSGQKADVFGLCFNKNTDVLYVSANTSGSMNLGNYSYSYKGNMDIFVAAIDTAGNFTWAEFGGSSGADAGAGVGLDKYDNVYTCGQFANSCSINGQTLNSAGGQDGYIFKYCNSTSAIDSTITTTGSTTLCGNDSVLFSVKYDPNYIYAWKLNGSSITGANSNSYYAVKQGSYSVLISLGGCCSQSQSQSIQVQNLSFSKILGNDTTICGTSYQLSATAPQGTSFLWNTGDTSRAITLNNSGTYSIIISYNGCVAYDTVQIGLKNITVSLGNDTVVCGNSLILDAQNSGMTYKWSDGSTNQTLKVNKTGSYTVAVSDAQCSVSDNIFVTIDVVSLNLGKDISTCSNKTFDLDAGTASKYLWNTGDTIRKITAASKGDYICTVTDVLGCKATDTININYFQNAVAKFQESYVGNQTYKFTPDSNQYASYTWEFQDSTTSTLVSPVHYFFYAGNMKIKLKVVTKDGCIDSFEKTIAVMKLSGIDYKDYAVNVFPNPNYGLFNIDFNTYKKSDVLIQSFDMSGRKVYENKLNVSGAGEQHVQINMQNVVPSIYHIKIMIDGVDTVHKLVHIY